MRYYLGKFYCHPYKFPERKKDERIVYDGKRILRKNAGQHIDGLQDDKVEADSGNKVRAVLENTKECF